MAPCAHCLLFINDEQILCERPVELLITVRCRFTTEEEPFCSFQMSPGIHRANFTAGIDGCGWTEAAIGFWQARCNPVWGWFCMYSYGFQQSSVLSWPTKLRDLERARKYSKTENFCRWKYRRQVCSVIVVKWVWPSLTMRTGLWGHRVRSCWHNPVRWHAVCAEMFVQTCNPRIYIYSCVLWRRADACAHVTDT